MPIQKQLFGNRCLIVPTRELTVTNAVYLALTTTLAVFILLPGVRSAASTPESGHKPAVAAEQSRAFPNAPVDTSPCPLKAITAADREPMRLAAQGMPMQKATPGEESSNMPRADAAVIADAAGASSSAPAPGHPAALEQPSLPAGTAVSKDAPVQDSACGQSGQMPAARNSQANSAPTAAAAEHSGQDAGADLPVSERKAAANPNPVLAPVSQDKGGQTPRIETNPVGEQGSSLNGGTESGVSQTNTLTKMEQATAQPGPPDYHKLQMRLSGSMCLSCLLTLKNKLKQVEGVERVRIDKPMHNVFQPYAPDVSSWADALIIYDANKISLDDLRLHIRTNGYVTYKTNDKPFGESLDSVKENKF